MLDLMALIELIVELIQPCSFSILMMEVAATLVLTAAEMIRGDDLFVLNDRNQELCPKSMYMINIGMQHPCGAVSVFQTLRLSSSTTIVRC